MSSSYDLFKKQGYHIAGAHSAVKTCLWSGRSVKAQGSCYKSKFYGIRSHRCIQMTPYLGCNQKCLHCWRPVEHPVLEPEQWDTPDEIVNNCIEVQRKLMSGYGGLDSVDKMTWKESCEPKHAAISLAGEPTLYPHLKELVEEYHKKKITTFVVTNGTNPDVIEAISPTQLYMSLNGPDKDTYLKCCRPNNNDQWDQILHSLKILHDHTSRVAIRLTLIKGLNLKNPEEYARLIDIAKPDFVEVKAYMHLGYSRKRLDRSSMPEHNEVLAFANQLATKIGYYCVDQVEVSRVVLLSRSDQPDSFKI
ncbi:MAG: 4-demethylwyosine synthase TYW1 [Methanosarcinales archaeon]